MEEILQYIQARQEDGVFSGRVEDVLQQIARLGETDPQFAAQKVIRRTDRAVRKEVLAQLQLLRPQQQQQQHDPDTPDTDLFEALLSAVRASDVYRNTRDHLNERAVHAAKVAGDTCTDGHLFSSVAVAPEAKSLAHGLGEGTQIFTFDDEGADPWGCDAYDAVGLHTSLEAMSQQLAGVVVASDGDEDVADPLGGGALDPSLVGTDDSRFGVLETLAQMSVDCTDTEFWPSVRENLIAVIVGAPEQLALAGLKTLVSFLKVCEDWQVSQVVVSLCRRLSLRIESGRQTEKRGILEGLVSPHSDDGKQLDLPEVLPPLLRVLHKCLSTVEGAWMHLDTLPKVFESLVRLLSHPVVLPLFAGIDPTATWYEAFMKASGTRCLLVSHPQLLHACARISLCNTVDSATATLASLSNQQRLSLLQKDKEENANVACQVVPETVPETCPPNEDRARDAESGAATPTASRTATPVECEPEIPSLRREEAATCEKQHPKHDTYVLLFAVHILGLTLSSHEGRSVFPLKMPGADLVPLHMFATRTNESSLLPQDEVVVSTAVQGVLLHAVRSVFELHNHGVAVASQLISVCHATVLSYIEHCELDSPVGSLLVINATQLMQDYCVTSVSAIPPAAEALLISSVRLIAELGTKANGRRLLLKKHPSGTLCEDADTLLSVSLHFVAVCCKERHVFSTLMFEVVDMMEVLLSAPHPIVGEATRLLGALLEGVVTPVPSVDAPNSDDETPGSADISGHPYVASKSLRLAVLDTLLKTMSGSTVFRAVSENPALMSALTKRAVARMITGKENTRETLMLLTASSDLLSEALRLQLPALSLARKFWQRESIMHRHTMQRDTEAELAAMNWKLLRLCMLSSTTWQTKSSSLSSTITSALLTSSDYDKHLAEVSILAASSVLMLDSSLVLIQKHDATKKLLTAQLDDTTLHPLSLLRHLMLCTLGTAGGPSERDTQAFASTASQFLFVEGPWEEQPDIAPPLGEVCASHCGVLYDDEQDEVAGMGVHGTNKSNEKKHFTNSLIECALPEVSKEDVTPPMWAYPNPPNILLLSGSCEAPTKLQPLLSSLKAAIEQASGAARSEGMEDACKEWMCGVIDIYGHALRCCLGAPPQPKPDSTRNLLNGGTPVHTRQLHLLILQFVNSMQKNTVGGSLPGGGNSHPPHVLAQTAAVIGVNYGISLGLIEGSATAHVNTLKQHLTDIDWVAVVLYIIAGESLLGVSKHSRLRYFGGDTTCTLRLTSAVEHVVAGECSEVLSALHQKGVPLFFVIHLWVRQVFLNFFDWDDVATTLCHTLLEGPEVLVCMCASALLHMKQQICEVASSGKCLATFFAITPVVNQTGRPFHVRDKIDTLSSMKSTYWLHITRLLN